MVVYVCPLKRACRRTHQFVSNFVVNDEHSAQNNELNETTKLRATDDEKEELLIIFTKT